MKSEWNVTTASTIAISVCLLSFVPGSLRFASTWTTSYFQDGSVRQQNLLMPLGFCSLAIEVIGLTVLWTAYRRKERWSWFVMLTILLLFVFPLNMIKFLLDIEAPSFQWSMWFQGMKEGYGPSIWTGIGVLTFVVMAIALLLPIRQFLFESRKVGTERA